MRIKIKSAPEHAKFTEGQAYPVYGSRTDPFSSFVFDDDVESFFLCDLEWEVFIPDPLP